MKEIKTLTLADAHIIAAAAEKEAQANGWAVSISVSDASGHALLLHRLDRAPLMSAQVAIEKAHASCMIGGKPSKVFEDQINNGRYAALQLPIMGVEGGEPVVIDGVCVGAVGVSGVKASEDAQIARAGITALLAA